MEERRLYSEVAGAIRDAFENEADTARHLAHAYRALRLLDDNDVLLVPEFEGLGFLDPFDVAEFVDRVVQGAAANTYINEIMRRARGKHFTFSGLTDRDVILRDATSYAVALDRLTRAIRNDWRLLDAARNHWHLVRQSVRISEIGNVFERVKVASMDASIERRMEALRTGRLPHIRNLLVLNIIEASLEDLCLGYGANAGVGLTLAMNRIDSPTHNLKTGAGPNRLSADGNAFQYFPPLPKQWVDLYSSWNLAFVSHYSNFPFFFAKLLNPQVLCYEGKPEEYLANRSVALYAHIHYEIFTRSDRATAARLGMPLTKLMNWADGAFTTLWAETNAASACNYADQLYEADPTGLNRFKRRLIHRLLSRS